MSALTLTFNPTPRPGVDVPERPMDQLREKKPSAIKTAEQDTSD